MNGACARVGAWRLVGKKKGRNRHQEQRPVKGWHCEGVRPFAGGGAVERARRAHALGSSRHSWRGCRGMELGMITRRPGVG